MLNDNERNLRIIGYILSFFSNILGISIFYLFINNGTQYSEGLKNEAKQLLNFSLSFAVYYFISFFLVIVLIGWLALIIFGILECIFLIIGFIKSVKNESYELPMTIKFIK